MAAISDARVLPPKGRRPAIISNTITPKEKMSVRASISRPSIVSGAMYGSVPMAGPRGWSRTQFFVSAAHRFCSSSSPSPGEPEVHQLHSCRREHDTVLFHIRGVN